MPNDTKEWLNENENRAYPLREDVGRTVPNTIYTLDSMLLDASFIYVNSDMPDSTALESISHIGTSITVNISGQSFSCSESDTFPAYIRNSEGSLLVVGVSIANIPQDVYVGGLDPYYIPTTFSDVYFEDAVSTELRGPWGGVSSISFNGSAVSGYIDLDEGYQFDINLSGGILALNANKDFGVPISTQRFYTSIPNDCAGIVSTINSVETILDPDIFRLIAGENVVIYDDPDNHRIYVGLNFDKPDVCKPIVLVPKQNTR